MHFHFSPYSSILLIFFSQGIIFSFLLAKKGITDSCNPCKWLSLFVFLCTLYLIPWMLGFAGWYSLLPYRDILFYIPFQQLFFIGPSIFFYTQSLLNPSFKFNVKDGIHLVPGLVYLLYRLIIFITDQVIFGQYYFYEDGRDKNLDTWYQMAGFVSMMVYFLLSLRYYGEYKKVIFQTLSYAETMLFDWVRKYLVLFLLMQVLWLVFFLFYPDWGNFKEKWWYYLAFSSLMYYIGLTGYTNNLKSVSPFMPSIFGNSEELFLEQTEIEVPNTQEQKPENNKNQYDSEQVDVWRKKISDLVEKEKLYLDPTLTLPDVANQLGTNPTLISKMINQGFKMNFNDFINEYRVKDVILALQEGKYKKHNLLGISIDSGFNSKTSFNRSFKKYLGTSPKDYLSKLKQSDSESGKEK